MDIFVPLDPTRRTKLPKTNALGNLSRTTPIDANKMRDHGQLTEKRLTLIGASWDKPPNKLWIAELILPRRQVPSIQLV